MKIIRTNIETNMIYKRINVLSWSTKASNDLIRVRNSVLCFAGQITIEIVAAQIQVTILVCCQGDGLMTMEIHFHIIELRGLMTVPGLMEIVPGKPLTSTLSF